MPRPTVEEVAMRRVGEPRALQAMLVCGALATGGIALWLVSVIAFVLPARDPAHVPLWSAIALACALDAALTLAYVLRGPRPAVLAPAVVVASLAAIAFGGWVIARMLVASGPGAHFEGYLLVIGVVLAGHGLCALAYATLRARRVRAA